MNSIRHACVEDLPEILAVYANARRFMRASGNPDQWSGGYPSETLLRSDIAANALYVLEGESHDILCVFAMFSGEEPTYRQIEGAWLNDAPYLTIHRIASAGKGRGIADQVFAWAMERTDNLRIDTHELNLPMQKCLARNGFVYCGVIHLENGDPRWAYQKTKGNPQQR